MTYPATTYAEGVELTITSGNQLHEIINGDATEEINTESGMVPSVRKALADSMLFKPAIAWAEGSVESDPFQTRLYGEGIYWAPAASNETPISMGTNPNIDGNWFLAPVTGGESISRNTNLLSNHNFIIQSPDDITHPSVTPTDYVAGTQVFSGVFVDEDIVGLTYVDGRVSWTSGTLYFSVPNSGALKYVDQTEFVASVADFDGKPRTRGVSFALVGDNYRVTVGVDALSDGVDDTLLGSVKFEQGKVATGHEVVSVSLSDTNKRYTVNFDSVASMKNGESSDGKSVSGVEIDSGDIVSRTTGYYGGWAAQITPVGGGTYLLTTLQRVRDSLSDPSWIPDGFGDFYLFGGTTYIAVLLWDGVVLCTQYGAKGDNIHQDGPNLEAALATGRNVHNPSGIYLCDRTLSPSVRNQSFTGDGYNATNGDVDTVSGATMIKYTNAVRMFDGLDLKGLTVEGIWWEGNATAVDGLRFGATTLTWDTLLRDLYIRNINGGTALDTQNCVDSNFYNIIIKGEQLTDYGIRVGATANSFIGGRVWDCKVASVRAIGSIASFSDYIFGSLEGSHILIEGDLSSWTFTACYFENSVIINCPNPKNVSAIDFVGCSLQTLNPSNLLDLVNISGGRVFINGGQVPGISASGNIAVPSGFSCVVNNVAEKTITNSGAGSFTKLDFNSILPGTLDVGASSGFGENTFSANATSGGKGVLAAVNENTSTPSGNEAPGFDVIKGTNDTTISNRLIQFFSNSGSQVQGYIGCSGAGAAQFVSNSDRELKYDIDYTMSDSLSRILSLKPCDYKWKSNNEQSRGFIAQDVESVYPEFVSDVNQEGVAIKMLGGSMSGITPDIVRSIQELKREIDSLKGN